MTPTRTIARGVSGAVLAAGVVLALAAPALAGPATQATTGAAATEMANPEGSAAPPGPLYTNRFQPDISKLNDQGTLESITYAQWRDDYNFRTPVRATDTVRRYVWSPAIVAFVSYPGLDPDLTSISFQLTPHDWSSIGNPSYETDPAGFLKLTWNSDLGYVDDVANPGVAEILTYENWVDVAFPSPLQAQRFPGDQFTQQCGSTALTYAGPTLYKNLTFAVAGRRRPRAHAHRLLIHDARQPHPKGWGCSSPARLGRTRRCRGRASGSTGERSWQIGHPGGRDGSSGLAITEDAVGRETSPERSPTTPAGWDRSTP